MVPFHLCTGPSKHILTQLVYYINGYLLGVDLEEDVKGRVKAGFDCEVSIPYFLEGLPIGNHFCFPALLQTVVLFLVHDRDDGIVDQFYFLLFRKAGLNELHLVAADPIKRVTCWLIDKLRLNPQDVPAPGDTEEVGLAFVVALQVLYFVH